MGTDNQKHAETRTATRTVTANPDPDPDRSQEGRHLKCEQNRGPSDQINTS